MVGCHHFICSLTWVQTRKLSIKHALQEMEATEACFTRLSCSCDTSTTTSNAQESATSALLHRCDALASELAAVRRKSEVVATFLRDYQLNAGDEETLREGDIDEAFFEALGRVRRVQRNCRALLHTHHQRAGLELLDAMASLQEATYERLCKCGACLMCT
jgi:conserved oligomeric Golgi complex subunit 6